MKKTYKTPTMKVRKIQCSHMLCGSNSVGFYRGVSIAEESDYDDYEGYDNAW